MRRWLFVLVMVVAACGGSDSAADTADAGGVVESGDGSATFASSDGVVSVQIPPGAAPDGFTGTVSLSDPSALGVDTSDVDSVLLAYELGPDGTEFSGPVTVTFRIPPALGGFDADLGLPISVIVIEDGAGGFEPLGSMTSFLDGDVLVVEGTTTHFTESMVVIGSVEMFLSLNPPGVSKAKNSTFKVTVNLRSPDPAEFESVLVGRTDFAVTGVLEVVSIDSQHTATLRCAEEGGGVVEATVFGDYLDHLHLDWLAQMLTGNSAEYLGRLSVEIECTEEGDSGTSSETGESEVALAIGEDPEGDGLSSSESEPVTSENNVPGADIKNVRHVVGGSGENCFIIEVYGDGETTVADAFQYQIFLKVVDREGGGEGGGWEMRVEFKNGLYEPGSVDLGLNVSFPPELEGAEVSVEWLDSSTLKVTVAGAGTALGVESFSVRIFTGDYYDDAEGIGAS